MEIVEYFSNELRKGIVLYDNDALIHEVAERINELSEMERESLIDRIASARAEKAVRDIIERNFKRVQDEIKAIIDKECSQSQELSSISKPSLDPRMVDPMHDF